MPRLVSIICTLVRSTVQPLGEQQAWRRGRQVLFLDTKAKQKEPPHGNRGMDSHWVRKAWVLTSPPDSMAAIAAMENTV